RPCRATACAVAPLAIFSTATQRSRTYGRRSWARACSSSRRGAQLRATFRRSRCMVIGGSVPALSDDHSNTLPILFVKSHEAGSSGLASDKRAYRCRFYPTPEQAAMLARTFGCAHYVYNWALRLRSEAYYARQERMSYANSSAALTVLKQQ